MQSCCTILQVLDADLYSCFLFQLSLFFNQLFSPNHGSHSLWFMLVPSAIVLGISRALSSPSFKEGHCAQISARPCPLVNFRFITSDSLPQLLGFLTILNDLLANRGLLFPKSHNFYTKTIPQAFQHFLHLLHANCTLTTWKDYFRLVKIREAILQLGLRLQIRNAISLSLLVSQRYLKGWLWLLVGKLID